MNTQEEYGTGVIKRLMPQGYGFITQDNGEDIFFHASNVEMENPFEQLNEGQKVEFNIRMARENRLNAYHVKVITT